jgi:hypothetical protein
MLSLQRTSRIGETNGPRGPIVGSKAETSRTNRELKLRGRLRRPFHRRGHAIGRAGMITRRGVPFSPRRRDSAPGGRIAGGFFVTDAEQGRPASMIEFIVIVVLLVLLIGIFVRREVFKW